MTSLFAPRESLVSDIPARDGNIEKLFLQCIVCLTGGRGVVCLPLIAYLPGVILSALKIVFLPQGSLPDWILSASLEVVCLPEGNLSACLEVVCLPGNSLHLPEYWVPAWK
jgi:hypothetical protein